MNNTEEKDRNYNLDLQNLAPVSVSVYNRVEHFKNCIKSLEANDLAKYSILYVFSDAALPGDEDEVSKVREYARSISGFKSTKLIFQKKNNLKKNMQDLFQMAFEINGKSIIMEDDTVVHKSFLKFMNMSLNIYEKVDKIQCISGYVGPENHLEKSIDVQAYLVPDLAGIGIWKKKHFDFLNDYHSCHPWLRLKKNFYYCIKFIFYFGISKILLFKEMYDKNLFYEDYLLEEYIYRKKKLVIIPPFTLTLNKGYDGSGINCGTLEEFQNENFLRYSDNFDFLIKFDESRANQLTKRTLKFRGLKPNLVRQVYALIAYFCKPPKIIRRFFKKIGF